MKKIAIAFMILLLLTLIGCSKKMTVVTVTPDRTNPQYSSPSQENINGSENHLRQAKRFYADGKYSQARKQCEKAIALNHRNWEAHYYLGLAMQKKDEYTISIEALGVGLKYAPDNKYVKSEIHFAIGYSWERLNEPKKAMTEYDQALAFNPGNDAARQAKNRIKVDKTMKNWDKDHKGKYDG